MTDNQYGLRDLGLRDRLRVIRAVNRGEAVSSPELAPYAVRQARRWQEQPKRGSVPWLVSWTEVGPLMAVVWVVIIVLVLGAWGYWQPGSRRWRCCRR
jgi:hypothetical protein